MAPYEDNVDDDDEKKKMPRTTIYNEEFTHDEASVSCDNGPAAAAPAANGKATYEKNLGKVVSHDSPSFAVLFYLVVLHSSVCLLFLRVLFSFCVSCSFFWLRIVLRSLIYASHQLAIAVPVLVVRLNSWSRLVQFLCR